MGRRCRLEGYGRMGWMVGVFRGCRKERNSGSKNDLRGIFEEGRGWDPRGLRILPQRE